jgi:hypothetical protein
MNVTLRPDEPLPTIHFESSTPLEQFQDAVLSQWRFRPPMISNVYVVTSNEIYLSDDARSYRRMRRTLDESLAHEFTHYLQVRYFAANLADESCETEAVAMQIAFRDRPARRTRRDQLIRRGLQYRGRLRRSPARRRPSTRPCPRPAQSRLFRLARHAAWWRSPTPRRDGRVARARRQTHQSRRRVSGRAVRAGQFRPEPRPTLMMWRCDAQGSAVGRPRVAAVAGSTLTSTSGLRKLAHSPCGTVPSG